MTKPDTSNITEENYLRISVDFDNWIGSIISEINSEWSKENDLQQHVGCWYFEYGEIEKIEYRSSNTFSCDRFHTSCWNKIDRDFIRQSLIDDYGVVMTVNNGKERRYIMAFYDYGNKKIGEIHEANKPTPVI